MTTTLLTTPSDAYITTLKSAFGKAEKPVEWLVIAHNDTQMLGTLSSALANQSAVVLERAQDTWDFDNQGFTEALTWALRQPHMMNLLLIGNSRAGGLESHTSIVPAATIRRSANGYGKLLAGVQNKNAQNHAAQKRFAAHFKRLASMPAVHNRLSRGELAVYGLFYQFESGLFLAYDTETEMFHALVA